MYVPADSARKLNLYVYSYLFSELIAAGGGQFNNNYRLYGLGLYTFPRHQTE